LVQLSTRCIRFVHYVMLPGSLVQLSARCVWPVPYARMFHGSLVQLSTSKRCVWVVPYVRMLLMYLVQFTTTCVSLVHNVRMLPPSTRALDEVCFTCTSHYGVSRVLGSVLYNVCLTCTLC
jgi:hypothetical protein